MPEQTSNIAKTLATIDADLIMAGWDMPAKLYQLIEDEQDPTAQLIGVLPTYPPDDLVAGYDAGSRCPENVHGLLISSEGLRHLHFEELLERHPDIIEKIKQAATREGLLGPATPLNDADVAEVVKNYYNKVMYEKLPPPSEAPPEMRVEMRITTAVLRDGTVHKYFHERDTDKAEYFVGQVDGSERLPDTLYMFLHGVRPNPECKDPKTVVEDYRTLEALAALPVAEER